jgi:hypothetical protein
VKDFHYLVSARFRTDSEGDRTISTTLGRLFSPQFEIIEYIRM